MILLETAYGEIMTFYTPIVRIEFLNQKGTTYGNYNEVLSIKFTGDEKIYYIPLIDENRKELKKSGIDSYFSKDAKYYI